MATDVGRLDDEVCKQYINFSPAFNGILTGCHSIWYDVSPVSLTFGAAKIQISITNVKVLKKIFQTIPLHFIAGGGARDVLNEYKSDQGPTPPVDAQARKRNR